MCIINRKYALAENSALYFEEQVLLLVMTARHIRHLSFLYHRKESNLPEGTQVRLL
jgi:hypothetical protein